MATVHPPNAIEWQAVDVVIHDADAKRADMLIAVLGRNAGWVYRTRCAYPAEQPKSWRHKVWRNMVESLHDPRRFGITTPAISPEVRASAEPRPQASIQILDPIATS